MLFTALHRLLGRGPSPITDDLLDAAVELGLSESDDLDWKSELPPTKGLAETDFPKDIAAMANSGGGVIVYGVNEQQKRAIGRTDVGGLTENHERTLRAAAYGAITPPVFIGVHAVGTSGKRAVAVIVPASVDGPHLIFRDKFFGAPLRNDADTEWMKERQIEAAYRVRLEERRRADKLLTQLYDETATNWNSDQRALVVAVARPRSLSTNTVRKERAEARSIFSSAERLGRIFSSDSGIHPLENVVNNPRPGLRRWVAINASTADSARWRGACASIHDNGSVSMTATVGGHRSTSSKMMRDSQVDSAAIESAVGDFMALIRTWSKELGLGEYEVRIGIEWPSSAPLLIQTVDQSGYPFDGTSVPLNRYTPVEVTVNSAASDPEFFRQVHQIAEDCVNQGGITNLRMIRPPALED